MAPCVTVLVIGSDEGVAKARKAIEDLDSISVADAEADRGVVEAPAAPLTWFVRFETDTEDVVAKLAAVAKSAGIQLKAKVGNKAVVLEKKRLTAAITLLGRLGELEVADPTHRIVL